MAEIKLFRIDFRLIHGQVITKWIKQVPISRIVIVDDTLADDEFMADIYRMAAPPDIAVEVYSKSSAVEAWNKDKMGDGNIMVLVRDVKTTLWLKQNGFGMDEVQVGGLGGSSGRVVVCPAITLDAQDAQDLAEIEKLGCKVYLHVLPAEPRMELGKALDKFNSLRKG